MAFQVKVVNKEGEFIPCTVFRKEGKYGAFYKVGVSMQDQKGEWVTSYIVAKFAGNVEFEDKTKILIKEATLIPTNDKDKVAMRVWEFNYDSGFKQVSDDNFCPF